MIFLSAGHNPLGPNPDPGACANGVREADLTVELRSLIAAELLKLHASFTVDSDSERLAQYIKRIHTGSGSVVCELHFNTGSEQATGVETLVRRQATVHEHALAGEINKVVTKHSGITNRGVKSEGESQHSRLAILHTGAGISVLPEICFITNKTDLAAYRKSKADIAKDIAAVLVKYDALAA